jgi:hypothetical protein
MDRLRAIDPALGGPPRRHDPDRHLPCVPARTHECPFIGWSSAE